MSAKSQDEEFSYIPMRVLLENIEKLPFELYLRLSESKYVKVSFRDENFTEELEKYQAKGVKKLYTRKEELSEHLGLVQENLENRLAKQKAISEIEKLETLSESHEFIGEIFSKIGVSKQSVVLSKAVSKNTQEFIQRRPGLLSFFKEFQDKCGVEYFRSMLVGFSLNSMIDTFTWRSMAIKEKANLAVMLCDATLTEPEIQEMRKNSKTPKRLSRKVRTHPTDLAKKLEQTREIDKETITIISEHHEQPDGDGYPNGINAFRITLLSAMYIIADEFAGRLMDTGFDEKLTDQIIDEFKVKFNTGNFAKGYQALVKVCETKMV